ncbi:MAG: hypothetical protein IPO75_17840 [Betaproteobacteria bacterium]|nr:hypothetical protein [Betaproteobacteria bacterium]
MTRASFEAQAAHRPGESPYSPSHAVAAPGIQRYAQTWTGDNTTSWETLRWNIRTGLQMSLSGMFNVGHDVGGFAGPSPDAELFLRWVQACCLNPRMVMNSWKADGTNNVPVLVAPVVTPGAVTRRVYLPRGPQAWIGFASGQSYAAGTTVLVPAPLECLPLFVRAGSVLPLADSDGRLPTHDDPVRNVTFAAGR